MSHGLGKIAEDTASMYYASEHGIKVVPHHGEWSGYYRLDSDYTLVLTAFAHGKAPGMLAITIRVYKELEAWTKAGA